MSASFSRLTVNGSGGSPATASVAELGEGLPVAPVVGESPFTSSQPPAHRKWPAHDAISGAYVSTHVRLDNPGEDKNVWWEPKGVTLKDLALYRAAVLLEYPDLVAVVCEGEATTDALATVEKELGMVVVGTVTGAGTTPGDAALSVLVSRKVYLWSDNDEPGIRHMGNIASRLHTLGNQEVLMVSWPDAPLKGGDAADAIAQGVDIKGLLTKSLSWQPTNIGLPFIIFRTAADIAANAPEETEYIAKPWLPAESLVEVSGKIKTAGKTTWVMAMCRKVLDGLPFMGQPTSKTPVVYLTEQNNASLMAALKRAGLLSREDFHVLAYKDAFGFSWPDIVKVAGQKCKETGARLLVVDTVPQWAGLQGTSENDSGAALEALAPLQVVAGHGIGVLCIRHDGKADRAVGDSGRGSSAWGGGVDTIISIRRPEGTSSPTARVLHCIGRFNELPDKWVIELDTETGEYRAIGTQTQQEVIDAVEAIKANSPRSEDEARTEADLFKEAEVKRTTGQEAVAELLSQGFLQVVGNGVKGDPRRYWAPEPGKVSTAIADSSGRTDSEAIEQTAPEKAYDGQKRFLPPLTNVVPAERNSKPYPCGETVGADDPEGDGNEPKIHSAATPSPIAAESNFDESVEV